jgi:hypothetical protein
MVLVVGCKGVVKVVVGMFVGMFARMLVKTLGLFVTELDACALAVRVIICDRA